MLKHRIIPILQYDGSQAVKTTQFRLPGRPVGSMMQHIMNMQRRDIDELIILDINATRENRYPHYDKIEKYARELYCPLTVGGGVSDLGSIKDLLNSGADKVAIKTATGIIPRAVEKFGAQCIVRVVDVGAYSPIPRDLQGVGEVLLTSIFREGTRKGYHIGLLKQMLGTSSCPVVINGGCGKPQHMLEAFMAGADAVAASSMFLFTDHTPKSCAKYLDKNNVAVRLDNEKYISEVDILWNKMKNEKR